MARPPTRELIAARLHRSVLLERDEGQSGRLGRIVKRFRSKGAWRRLLDGARARREWRAMRRLGRLGLPVPEALELRRRDGAWELSSRYVADAQPLRSRLEAGSEPDLARRLARLAARARALGLRHADLHTDNLLLDATGGIWLVDCAHARLARDRAPLPLEDELVGLAAQVRECVPARFRMRFLVELLRPAGTGQAFPRAARACLAARVEERARVRRHALLRGASRRWTRDSSAVRSLRTAAGRAWLRRGVEELPELSDLRLDGLLRPFGPLTLLGASSGHHGAQRLVYGARAWRELRSAWYEAARLSMHGVPCGEPLCLMRGPRPWMAVELPHRARQLAAPVAAPDRIATARALGGLLGTLADRGFALLEVPAGSLWLIEDDRPRLALTPGARLTRCGPLPAPPDPELASLLGEASGEERGACVAELVAACRGGPAEAGRWERELRRG